MDELAKQSVRLADERKIEHNTGVPMIAQILQQVTEINERLGEVAPKGLDVELSEMKARIEAIEESLRKGGWLV